MNEFGKLERDLVIAVVRANEVEVHGQENGPPNMLVLAKGERVEGQLLPEMVDHTMIRYLSRQFHIPLSAFYNPELGASETPS
jgi:hypothetical protein